MTEEAKTEAAVEKAPKVEQIGVSRPKVGTTTERVWAIADALSTAAGKAIERKPVLDAAVAEGINPATAATQYGRWCKFFGVKHAPPKAPKAATPAKAAAETDVSVEEEQAA
jgi:hypothetical protein